MKNCLAITKLGSDLEPQFAALAKMRDEAHAEGISKEDGQKYFDLQYGTDPKKRMIAFIKEVRSLPTEALADLNFEKAFVNEGFIYAWNLIEGLNVATTTDLVLFNKNLHRLPRNIGNLINLTTLKLNHNQLTTLPKEIGNLSNLTDLTLYNNKLTSVPKEIGNLTKLTRLNLLDNQLTSVPDGFFKALLNLRHLFISESIDMSKADIDETKVRVVSR